LEGSLDGSQWSELDRHEDDTTTNDQHRIGTFRVSDSQECRFIRIQQTGKNSGGQDYLVLYAFEIFGRLIE
jgi:hypothetical protein